MGKYLHKSMQSPKALAQVPSKVRLTGTAHAHGRARTQPK